MKCVDTVVDLKGKKDKIIIGVGHSDYNKVVELIEYSNKKEIEGFLIPPPYYLKLDEESIIKFFEKIREKTIHKIYYYNIPQLTNNPLTTKGLRTLIENKLIDGIKDTSGDMTYFQKIIQICTKYSSFITLIGDDYLALNALILGCDGGILGTGNIIPEIWSKIVTAITEGQISKARKLQLKALPYIDAMFTGVFPAALYYILYKKGVNCGEPKFPIRPLNIEEKQKVDSLLEF